MTENRVVTGEELEALKPVLDKPYFIDWEIAAIYPYFIDISRFALVTDDKQEFNICEEAQNGFFNSYYEEMAKNPLFKVSREQYRMDMVIYMIGLGCVGSVFNSFQQGKAVKGLILKNMQSRKRKRMYWL